MSSNNRTCILKLKPGVTMNFHTFSFQEASTNDLGTFAHITFCKKNVVLRLWETMVKV